MSRKTYLIVTMGAMMLDMGHTLKEANHYKASLRSKTTAQIEELFIEDREAYYASDKSPKLKV